MPEDFVKQHQDKLPTAGKVDDPFVAGLRTLARMIARDYLSAHQRGCPPPDDTTQKLNLPDGQPHETGE